MTVIVLFDRDLTNVFISTDELSEIMSNMTKTLHMNTPEHTVCNLDIDDDNETKLSNKETLIEQLKIQLVQNKLQRTQPRDYLRILSQSKTPAQWYKAPSTSRSVYFYDPNYQKRYEEQSVLSKKAKVNAHVSNDLFFSILYSRFFF